MPMKRLDTPEGAGRVASKVRQGGRAAAFPDLKPIQDRMPARIQLANREMPMEGHDGGRRELLKHLEVELRDAIGIQLLRQCCRYVVLLEVSRQFYWRGQTGVFRRDLYANELNSLRRIMREREQLPVTVTGIRKRLSNVTVRADFWSPMGIIQRLAELVDGFAGAARMVVSATGACRIQLVIDTLPATLVLVETIMQYHWQWLLR